MTDPAPSNPQGIAYLAALNDVYHNPDYILSDTADSPNRQGCREKINYTITINTPTREPVITGYGPRDQIVKAYTEAERVRFDQGDITHMGEISSFWNKIKNPDGTINANYGYMVYHILDAGNPFYSTELPISQWQWAKNRLLLNKDTAQAIMHFNRPKDQYSGNLDQPCCMYSQFLIRNDLLHYTINMRSNDLWFGTPYNLAYHIELMYRMRDELPWPLGIGTLTLNTTSLHIYRRHWKLVEAMLEATAGSMSRSFQF